MSEARFIPTKRLLGSRFPMEDDAAEYHGYFATYA